MLRKHHFNGKKKRTKSSSACKQSPVAWVIVFFALVGVVALGSKVYQKAIDLSYPQEYTELVEYWAEEYEVDPLLVYAFIRTESGFDETAQSNVDARGLMQITSDTFDWIKSKIAVDEDLIFEDMYDPEVNIRFGVYYISRCLARYENDVATAAAAYHSGWGTVDDLLSQEKYSQNGLTLDVFPYTQMKNYVFKIAACYEKYNELYGSEKVV
ncbi:MAG: lytic transglycosylase domain-containing protein [Faecalibacterium sp.]